MLTMQTDPAVKQNKNIRWSESPWNQSGRKGSVPYVFVCLSLSLCVGVCVCLTVCALPVQFNSDFHQTSHTCRHQSGEELTA